MEKDNKLEQIDALLKVIAQLRDPEKGCPWEKEQTHESLKQFIIEEAYELVDAIDQDKSKVCEELGDVLLQVLLHSQIASENNEFDFYQVAEELRKKLIRRHPHVFGDVVAKTAEQVLDTWQKVKKQEKGVLDGVPRALPALLRATKITDRARRSEFKIDPFNEYKLKELLSKITKDDNLDRDDFKQALFQLAMFTQRHKYSPEELLQEACTDFTDEFKKIESNL